MPIGVPRILYCWTDELAPQWTDIYNFVFRQRMVFLMQYLNDELCNQICGLLVNIHMEDLGDELEKKKIAESGIFKKFPSSIEKSFKPSGSPSLPGEPPSTQDAFSFRKTSKDGNRKSMSELLDIFSDPNQDLSIFDNDDLEKYGLQEITLRWCAWYARFHDFSDEPYFFELAQTLSFGKTSNDDTQLMLQKAAAEGTGLPIQLRIMAQQEGGLAFGNSGSQPPNRNGRPEEISILRSLYKLADFISEDKHFSFKNLVSDSGSLNKERSNQQKELLQQKPGLSKLIGVLASKNFANKKATNSFDSSSDRKSEMEILSSLKARKALGQLNLKREYRMDNSFPTSVPRKQYAMDNSFPNQVKNRKALSAQVKNRKALSYLDLDSAPARPRDGDNRSYLLDNVHKSDKDFIISDAELEAKKEFAKSLLPEEDKMVYVMINSYGGAVGNGITLHDALQFIRAGSTTIAIGVAASAATLVLAAGTITERYIVESCHCMIHQPAGTIKGQSSDIWIDSQEIMKIRLDVAEIYSLSAHRPRHKIFHDLDRDFYLTSLESIYYGLADEMATNEVIQEVLALVMEAWYSQQSNQIRLLEAFDKKMSSSTEVQPDVEA